MSDPFALVTPGAPLAINATAWNLMLAGARERAGRGRGPNADDLNNGRPTPVKILVHNSTGSNFPHWGIVSVGAPAFIPASSSELLQPEYAYTAAAPTAGGLFAVCQQMIPTGSVGFAVVQGVTPCTLNVTATGDTHADATTSTTELTTGTSGRAEILYKASGTGSGKIGVVLVTNAAPPSAAAPETDAWYLTADKTITVWGTSTLTGWTNKDGSTTSTNPAFPSTGDWLCTLTMTGEFKSSGGSAGPMYLLGGWGITGTGAPITGGFAPWHGGVVAHGLADNAGGDYVGAGSLTLTGIFTVNDETTDELDVRYSLDGSLTTTGPYYTITTGKIYANTYFASGSVATVVHMKKISG